MAPALSLSLGNYIIHDNRNSDDKYTIIKNYTIILIIILVVKGIIIMVMPKITIIIFIEKSTIIGIIIIVQ